MYKSKERSYEAYPIQDMYTRFIEGSNIERREIYVKGYDQAVLDVASAFEEEIQKHECPEHGYLCDCLYEFIEKIKNGQR